MSADEKPREGRGRGMLSFLIPTEKRFYDLLSRQSAKALEGAEALADLVTNFTSVPEKAARLTRIEKEADQVRREISSELARTFITPLDREDINNLSVALDDLLDYAEGVSTRIVLFELDHLPRELEQLAALFLESVRTAHRSVSVLQEPRRALEESQSIHRLENEADAVYRVAVASLFREKDALQARDVVRILKLKEIVETLEDACDKCEDIADVIDEIVVKVT
ncbi:MAG: DUF47 family protein [Euryarchaeota archaeon]|nr:DUF47 family protein [Euryarchaeota archaeon]